MASTCSAVRLEVPMTVVPTSASKSRGRSGGRVKNQKVQDEESKHSQQQQAPIAAQMRDFRE
jgi:hypothetical protein